MAAPSGGGGGGGPVGFSNSFVGPQEALEVIGNHAYAYSGLFPASTTETTALSFTSGNYYLVGDVQVNSAIDDDNPENATSTSLNIKFNGTSILLLGSGGDVTRSKLSIRSKIIIPPYTEVECVLDNGSDAPDNYASASIVGRIYRS